MSASPVPLPIANDSCVAPAGTVNWNSVVDPVAPDRPFTCVPLTSTVPPPPGGGVPPPPVVYDPTSCTPEYAAYASIITYQVPCVADVALTVSLLPVTYGR